MKEDEQRKVYSPAGWHKSASVSEASGHAWHGIGVAFRSERNLRVQLVIYAVALVLAYLIGLSFLEIAIVIMVGVMIIAFEMINTAVEHFSDIVEPKYSETVKHIKDISAGAVLLVSGAAIVIGILIYLPPIILSVF